MSCLLSLLYIFSLEALANVSNKISKFPHSTSEKPTLINFATELLLWVLDGDHKLSGQN